MQELGDHGEYSPVEVCEMMRFRGCFFDFFPRYQVQPRTDVGTGGIFQLRQGQQRRIVVSVGQPRGAGFSGTKSRHFRRVRFPKWSFFPGTLPVVCDAVTSVSVGAPCVRSKLQKPLDSYQVGDSLGL